MLCYFSVYFTHIININEIFIMIAFVKQIILLSSVTADKFGLCERKQTTKPTSNWFFYTVASETPHHR